MKKNYCALYPGKINAVRTLISGALAATVLLPAMVLADEPAATQPYSSNLGQQCKQNADGVENVLDALRCGSVHGSLRSLYYSTKNAYFVKDNNQDTASYGGNILYQTAPYLGFSAGVGGIYQQQWRSPAAGRGVTELATNQNGVGEAWLRWQNPNFRITAGDQRIDIPFMSDYDWRITPILFRAIDVNWGDKTDFLHATKVYRYKPWRSDKFLATSAYSAIKEETNGAWAVGAGRSLQAGDAFLTGQMWYESYDDFVNIFYTEGHAQWKTLPWQPDVGVQFIRGAGEGEQLRGEVDNTSYGLQLSLAPSTKLKWSLNYNHMVSNPQAYLNGALVTPYSSSTSSGKYFAQPYFTSTQDLGTGNAYATRVSYQLMPALTIGTYYSFMDLRSSPSSASRNQSEYVIFGIYNFDGALKGLSLSNFLGVQTSPLYDYSFWQNRVAVQYNF